MKPLKLTMQAFGSYVKPGTIDFEKPAQNLFLITGDTGAGKRRFLMPLYLPCMEKQVLARIKKMEMNCRVSMQIRSCRLLWN